MPEAAHWTSPPPEDAAGGDGDGDTPGSPPRLLWIDAFRSGDRTAVAVQGELDMDACEWIEHDLSDAMSRSVRGIDLHLDAVPFCDCAGLNMLLRLRFHALAQDRTVIIRSSSPAVERLLDLTGARKLFVAPDRPAQERPAADGAPPHQGSRPEQHHDRLQDQSHDMRHDQHQHQDHGLRHDQQQDLPTEVAQLRRAMQTRPAIDLARGILMATFTLSPEAAWAVLVTASQNTNTKLYRLAQDLVNSVLGGALPEAVQGQLAAAVAKAKAAQPSRTPARGSLRGNSHRPVRNTVPGQGPASPGE
ncbi:ANTAR domain-containing protein [Streptomyces sp. NPDC018019]|uniref:ANTAR domain-containing protein n=1 Tax=Streptomyces sp. NPDC018019 TaxID=3365030 RepID=UPI0037A3ABA0